MLYQRYNEIQISNYIAQLLYGNVINELFFIIVLDFKYYEKEFELDMYYLITV